MNQKEVNKVCDENRMIYCFDIDDTICKMETETNVVPINERIEWIREKYDEGNTILLLTARASNLRKLTEDWLKKHKVPYHELHMDKPKAHMYIDDCTENSDTYFGKSKLVRKGLDEYYKLKGNEINKKIRK